MNRGTRTATWLLTAALALAGASAGCGRSASQTALRLAPDLQPVPIGRGPAYRLPSISPAVARRAAAAGLGCAKAHGNDYGVHIELYAHRLVLPVPAGIGIAPPQHRQGAYVRGGSCSYPIRTFEPTGVVVVDRAGTARTDPRARFHHEPARPLTLGALFGVWGQPLSSHSLTGFRGPVLAFVAGRPWRAPPARIPLSRHAEIVLEVDGHVPPHHLYHFPPGL